MIKTCLLLAFGLAVSVSATELPLAPDAKGFPQGWNVYGKGPGIIRCENGMVRIADQSDNKQEWGMTRSVNVPAAGKYAFTLDASCVADGAQMVVLYNVKDQATGKNKTIVTRKLVPVTGAADKFVKTVFEVTIQEGVSKIGFYIYSQYVPKADFTIRSIDFAPAK